MFHLLYMECSYFFSCLLFQLINYFGFLLFQSLLKTRVSQICAPSVSVDESEAQPVPVDESEAQPVSVDESEAKPVSVDKS